MNPAEALRLIAERERNEQRLARYVAAVETHARDNPQEFERRYVRGLRIKNLIGMKYGYQQGNT